MPYIDGFVLPLPKDKIDDYKRQADGAGKIWLEHGALEYRESLLEDPKADELTPFTKLAGANDSETVIFAYITYENREQRDAVNKKVMADERLHALCSPDKPLFDFKRMAYGGFEVIVDHS